MAKIIVLLILSLSILGLADTSYLTYEHFSSTVPSCRIVNLPINIPIDCGGVLTGEYSTFMGIPVAFLGLLFYLLVFGSSLFIILKGWYTRLMVKKYFLTLGLIGFTVSAILVYIMLFVIKMICLYCMLSAFTSSSILGLSIWMVLENQTPLPKNHV